MMTGQAQENPSGADPSSALVSSPQLTVAQVDRLIKAMGREMFRRWYDAYRRGESKETVQQLLNVLDTVGEDAFQLISIESAPPNPTNQPTVAPVNNGIVNRMASPTPPNPVVAASATLVVPPAVAIPPLDTIPIPNPTPQPPPIHFQQLAGMGAYTPSLMEASLWTDAQVVVGPDGMARVIPLPRAVEPPAVPIADIGAAPQTVVLPADAVAVAPTPPAVPPSNCEQCGEEVAGDYSSRRRHVFKRHDFQPETTELATQEALKEAIGKCFPQAVVRNDLMCNHPGCGMEVKLYKGKTGEMLQKLHIQQSHLPVVAEDICPVSCPVRGCVWGGTRRDSEALCYHINKFHKGPKSLSEGDEAAYNELLDRLKTASSDSLRQFFPHSPIGVLCVGDKSKEVPGTARIETRLPRIDTATRPAFESEGQEPVPADCNECGEAVSASYIDRREHVVGHMEGGKLPSASVLEQQDSLRMMMLQCFPEAIVANDLVCNRCGMEVKDVASRTVGELQSRHVQQYHFDSVGEGAKIECPITGCSKTWYPILHMPALNNHVHVAHGGVQKLKGRSKRNYEQLRDRVKEATKELLPTHFPVTPNGLLTRKRKIPLDINDAERENLRRLAWD